MYEISDTIAAVSSASVKATDIAKTIIRISGPETLEVINNVLEFQNDIKIPGIISGSIPINSIPKTDAVVYSFASPHSYTGDDLVEIHVYAADPAVRIIMEKIYSFVRPAEAGEFTLRAYLNGKMDLAQAEAVSQIISSSNHFQLAAAQKLLSGRLSESIRNIRTELLDIMSLLEASLDFSTEGIKFISVQKASQELINIKSKLQNLLNSNIHYEEMIDLPSVGLAGAANAGKSSLINALLGTNRSIVSKKEATTRDVLTGILKLENTDCALFDCAGLNINPQNSDILDQLAQQAAAEALKVSDLVLFCIDITKEDFTEEIKLKSELCNNIILVGTKCDLLNDKELNKKKSKLEDLLQKDFILTSSVTSQGLEELRKKIDKFLIQLLSDSTEAAEKITINQRHHMVLQETVNLLEDSVAEVNMHNEEVAAMLIRSAYQELSGIEKEDIDEAILERIFSSFCIGK